MRDFRAAVLASMALGACYSGASSVGESDGEEDSGSGGELPPPPPEDASLVAPSGLRRLTVAEYNDTLRDLLGDSSQPAVALFAEDPRTPFDNDYTIQSASQALIEGADLLGSDAADDLLADPERKAAVLGCAPTGPDDETCFRQFIKTFGRRALRRPLTAAEVDRYAEFLEFGVQDNQMDTAVATTIRALLQEPEFLYRVEIGRPVPESPGVFKLTDWEVASKLSYFLWGSTPDDWLLDLAEAGALSTPLEVRQAAERMLEDPRAIDRIDRFHALWMGYEQIPHAPQLANAMRTETRALVQRVVFDEDRPWQDMLRLDETFVDDALAQHYGIPAPGSPTPTWTSYGESGRRGLLSHGSFLSIGAKFDDTSPVQRGLLIRTRLFCQVIPPPPPDAGVDIDEPINPDPDLVCKADRYAVHSEGACAGCHDMLDPVGFGLENYDMQGRYREVEDGMPECTIDGQGEIVGVGTFSGPAELGALMIDSGLLNACVVRQLYRFTVGRSTLDEADERMIVKVLESLGQGDFQFRALLLQVVSDDGFGYRRDEETN